MTREIPNSSTRHDPAHEYESVEPLEEQGDFDEEDEDQFDADDAASQRRKRIPMFCFHCNRREGHFLSKQHRWYYSFLVGLTFGLVRIVGPFQCQCCGASRLMSSNFTNLRYWYRSYRERGRTTRRRGRS